LKRIQDEFEQTRRQTFIPPNKDVNAEELLLLEKELAMNEVARREDDVKMMERLFEEIKDGKKLTSRLISEETLTKIKNLEVLKVVAVTDQQQHNKLVRKGILNWLKKRHVKGDKSLELIEDIEMAR
jgi:hypothetical protein